MIDNNEDIIDSRDVIDRISEIESEALTRYEETLPEGEGTSWGEIADLDHAAYLDPDDAAELAALRALADEGENSAADWEYGAALIRDSYFIDYARDFAEDIGAMPEGNSWPVYCIDWEWAARELRMDYTPVEFDGVTYWVRS